MKCVNPVHGIKNIPDTNLGTSLCLSCLCEREREIYNNRVNSKNNTKNLINYGIPTDYDNINLMDSYLIENRRLNV